MAASNAPKMMPTRSRVLASTPLTPMPMHAARLSRPSEAATSSRATMARRRGQAVSQARILASQPLMAAISTCSSAVCASCGSPGP